jgi:hypothetical protein
MMFSICVAAMVIIVSSTQFDANSEDITWNLSVIIIWASVEVNLVTVSGTSSPPHPPSSKPSLTHTACLPTVRPAFLYLFTSSSPTSSIPSSYGLSHAKKSNARRTIDDADDSSTYQLADSVKGGSGSVSDFETHALDRGGTHTKIIGSGALGGMEGQGGIMVRNETVVRVSDARPRGF